MKYEGVPTSEEDAELPSPVLAKRMHHLSQTRHYKTALAILAIPLLALEAWQLWNADNTTNRNNGDIVANNNHGNNVASAPSATTKMTNKTMGFIVVDIRTDGILGERVKPLMTRIAELVDLPIELWLSEATTDLDVQLGTDLMDDLVGNDRLSFRVMKQNHTYGTLVEDLQGVAGGHIGKGYALKESKFDIPIFIDSDVWPCNSQFVKIIQETIGRGKYDVLWTQDPYKYGATKKKRDGYVSPEIKSQLEEYKEFPERNTGTIFAVDRRNPTVQSWLAAALDIWVQQTNQHPSILRRRYTDQAAFRESFFLHRQKLTEYLVGDEYACRFYGHFEDLNLGCDCACDCHPCVTVHKKDLFDICAGLRPPPP